MDRKRPNIILHKYYQKDGLKPEIIEVTPEFSKSNFFEYEQSDVLHFRDGSLFWCQLPKYEVIEKGKIRGTKIYYKDGRIGIERSPLHSYKFDISVPENTLMTAFHVGDGKYGFSMGNGTSKGFIPEIIGMGSDEYDAGLYFLGKAGNNKLSQTPLIIIDGRNHLNKALKNRPILGVTSGDYGKYKFLIDQNGKVGIGKIPKIYKMEVQGSIQADDVVIDGVSIKALIDVIKEQQEEIDRLKQNKTVNKN